MDPMDRMKRIRLLDKMNEQPKTGSKLGLKDRSHIREVRGQYRTQV